MSLAGRQTVHLNSLNDFCQRLVATLAPKQLILLDGPLGAGKTQFVKSCVSLLGGEMPESPTFSVINEYKANLPVWHVDLYRLESAADIESTGFWDLFSESRGVIFVEWAEKIPLDRWPLHWRKLHVQIGFSNDEKIRLFDIGVPAAGRATDMV